MSDRFAVLRLTAAGIRATTFGDILGQDRETILGWREGPLVAVDDGSRVAAAAVAKLRRDGIPTVVVGPDRRRP